MPTVSRNDRREPTDDPIPTDTSRSDAGSPSDASPEAEGDEAKDSTANPRESREIGGPKGLEPTRYGDWERKGRCIDF